MPFALLLALAAVASGTLLTYVYDRKALFLERLCAGVCTGLTALGLLGFVVASWAGMTPTALVLAGAVVASPLPVLLRGRERRAALRRDVAENWRAVRRAAFGPREGEAGRGTVALFVAAAVLFWFVVSRAMFETEGGIFTGVDNNLGDLPLHLAIVTGFLYGDNFPPQHPEFAGARMTYPFLVDFVPAMFARAGASLEGSLFWQGYVLALALVGLLHRWARQVTRDHVASALTVLLVLLSGGFGWVYLLGEARDGSLLDSLRNLPHDYSVTPDGLFRWANVITALLVPQRGFLLGLPLALLIWILWWQAMEEERQEAKGKGQKAKGEVSGAAKRKKGARGKGRHADESASEQASQTSGASNSSPTFRPFAFHPLPFALTRMAAAGVVAGLLPLAHAHTFVVVMGMGGCLALLHLAREWRKAASAESAGDGGPSWRRLAHVWQPWAAFFVVALVISVPQLFWVTRERGIQAESFFGFAVGWDRHEQNPFWFWIKNTGFFIPLLVAALVWRGGGRPLVPPRLFYFYLPFTLCFIVPNLVRMSPWIWDNIKILIYWYVASAPLVALVLARLWRRGWAWRAAALSMLLATTLAGALDVWRVVAYTNDRELFDGGAVRFAELVRRETPPRSLILHAPAYNDPVYLTGRRSFIGYPGHLGSHGFDYGPRLTDLKKIYGGGAEADALLRRHGIEYVVVGPLEREILKNDYGVQVNDAYFSRYAKVGESGVFKLYKTARP